MAVSIDLGLRDNGQPALLDLEELLATRLLVQGNSGCGKSHLLRRLLERSAPYFDKVTFPAGCMNGRSRAVGGSRLWFPLTPKFRIESMGLHESGVGRGAN